MWYYWNFDLKVKKRIIGFIDNTNVIINKYPEVKKVNHFNSTPVGYRYQISFTIFVDGKMSTYDSHAIADRLEKEITNKFDDIYLTVIHVNPIDIDKL